MADDKVKKTGLTTIKALAKLLLEEVKKLIAKAVSDVKADLGSALTYKGSVATYDALPKEGQAKGDTYNVEAAFEISGKKYPEGTNVAWDGTKWDPLGGVVDLSNLATKDELNTLSGKVEKKLDTETYEADKATFETKDNASKTYQTQAGMAEYLKIADLGDQFEEFTEDEVKGAISDLLSE